MNVWAGSESESASFSYHRSSTISGKKIRRRKEIEDGKFDLMTSNVEQIGAMEGEGEYNYKYPVSRR